MDLLRLHRALCNTLVQCTETVGAALDAVNSCVYNCVCCDHQHRSCANMQIQFSGQCCDTSFNSCSEMKAWKCSFFEVQMLWKYLFEACVVKCLELLVFFFFGAPNVRCQTFSICLHIVICVCQCSWKNYLLQRRYDSLYEISFIIVTYYWNSAWFTVAGTRIMLHLNNWRILLPRVVNKQGNLLWNVECCFSVARFLWMNLSKSIMTISEYFPLFRN